MTYICSLCVCLYNRNEHTYVCNCVYVRAYAYVCLYYVLIGYIHTYMLAH